MKTQALPIACGRRSPSKQRVEDDSGNDDQNRRHNRHLLADGAIVCGTLGLPCGPPLLEIRGCRCSCDVRRRWWRRSRRYVDSHATLTQKALVRAGPGGLGLRKAATVTISHRRWFFRTLPPRTSTFACAHFFMERRLPSAGTASA